MSMLVRPGPFLEDREVTREWIREGQAVDVRDLIYEEEVQRLLLQLRVGIFHDIELRIQAPLILNENKAIFRRRRLKHQLNLVLRWNLSTRR